MNKLVSKSIIILVSLSLLLSCAAIQNSNSKQKGAVIGTAGGAAAGAVLGKQLGDNSVLGAIIGGVLGGVAGTYIGDRMDRQAEKIKAEIPGAEVTRVGEGINVTFDENSGVYFDSNKYNINTTSAESLQKLANVLLEYPKTNILIEGHTDSTGKDTYNMKLSKKRATAVSNFLESRGLSANRLVTKWYGETQPKADNSTATGRAKNRRVEIAIIADEELKNEAKQQTMR